MAWVLFFARLEISPYMTFLACYGFLLLCSLGSDPVDYSSTEALILVL